MSLLIRNNFKKEKEKDFNNLREKISEINTDNLINEALYMGKKISYKNKNLKNITIKDDLLEEIRSKVLKAYLESVKDKTIKEIKTELNAKIDEYIKNIRILLLESNFQIDKYKKISEKIENENINIKQINSSLMIYNQDILKEINNYQSNLNSLQKSYKLLLKQKDLFDVILEEYSSKSPEEILSELKLAKEGSLQLLENYNEIMRENTQLKKDLENEEKKYRDKIDSILKNFNDFKENKINEEKQNLLKIKFLENKVYDNENYQKENYNLHRTLYYIYNLLFKEFGLNKYIKIDKKYMDLRESDFNPNVMYDLEIKNYIELMVKSMHKESLDIIFRECIGYLNMIIRKYFPNKKNLRFKPVDILIEINNFIGKAIKKINDNKILINQYKNNNFKLEKENIKINKKLSKEIDTFEKYDSYQFLSDKKLSMEINNLKRFKTNFINRNNYNNKANSLTNPNLFTTPYNNKIKKNDTLTLNSNKNLSLFKITKNKKENNIMKEQNKLVNSRNSLNDEKILKTFSLYPNKEIEKNFDIKEDNTFLKLEPKKRNQSNRTLKTKKLKKKYKDKIIRENGNDKQIKLNHDCNFVIEEINRLFLYKPRMNSFKERINQDQTLKYKESRFKQNQQNINTLLKLRNSEINELQNDKNENMKKKIFGEINNLIKKIQK